MRKELNTIKIFNGVQRFLRKHCAYHNIEHLPFTLMVYYKVPEPGAVFMENGDINKPQRKECLDLLATMLDTKVETSAPFDFKGEKKIGAIATENMVIAMAGLEPVLAKAVITQMLHHQQIFTHEDYLRIYDYLREPDIFAILGSGTITFIILSANPAAYSGVVLLIVFLVGTHIYKVCLHL